MVSRKAAKPKRKLPRKTVGKRAGKHGMAKRKTVKVRQAKSVQKMNESHLRVAKDRSTAPRDNPGIEDSGAVQVARTSIENVVDEARKTIEAAEGTDNLEKS